MAALQQQLHDDLTAAIKAHDTVVTSTLRMAIAAIRNAEVAGKVKRELTEVEEIAVVAKEVAKGKDSAEAYAAGGRQDLVDKELEGVRILSAYLPQGLSEAEVDQIVTSEVAAAVEGAGGEKSMRLMGPVMKAVGARVAGRADGAVVAAKVRAALA